MEEPLRVIRPNEKVKKPTPLKDFLTKPANELTIGDTFLMQAGNSLIAVSVPLAFAGLGFIFSILANRQNAQELHGL